MTGSELVAITRLLKATGKLIGEIISNKSEQKNISMTEKEISITNLTNTNFKKKIFLLENIQRRSKEYQGINITDLELKKIIEWEYDRENIYITFFKYLLLLYAIKIKGMTEYLKRLTETKMYLDASYNGQIKKELLNVNTPKEISILTRLWVPLLIKQMYKETKRNEEYIINNK